MDTSHLVTSVETENIDTEDIYDEDEIQSSINQILGASSSIQQSSEDWMQNISHKIEESVENYYTAAVNFINGERYPLTEEAQEMADTMHSLDQSLEFFSMSNGAINQDYKNTLLEVKNRLEDEVIAPLTAAALENGDFTTEIPEEDVDYLLRPVRDNYLRE